MPKNLNFVAFDFETANRFSSSVCALGLAFVNEGVITDKKYWLIKPIPSRFEGINMSIHGIRPEDVVTAPTFGELWSEIEPHFEGQHLVAHNAAFDIGCLKASLNTHRLQFPNAYYYCSMYSSRKILSDLPRHRLNLLAEYYGLDINHHHAESDAIACAEIMIRLCQKVGANSLDEFMQIQEWKVGQLVKGKTTHVSFSTMKKRKKKKA